MSGELSFSGAYSHYYKMSHSEPGVLEGPGLVAYLAWLVIQHWWTVWELFITEGRKY